jgi:hypothetical protein
MRGLAYVYATSYYDLEMSCRFLLKNLNGDQKYAHWKQT